MSLWEQFVEWVKTFIKDMKTWGKLYFHTTQGLTGYEVFGTYIFTENRQEI